MFGFSKRVDALRDDVAKATDQLLNLNSQISALSATVHTTAFSKVDSTLNLYLDRERQIATDLALQGSPPPPTTPYALERVAYVAEADKKLLPAIAVLRALYSYCLAYYTRRLPTYHEVMLLPPTDLISRLKDCINLHPMLPELRERRLQDLDLINSLGTLRDSVHNGSTPVPSVEAGVPLLDQVGLATVAFQSYLTTIASKAAGI
jgi:hypothetical protein